MIAFVENYWQWLIGSIIAIISIWIAFLQYKKKQEVSNQLKSGNNSPNVFNSPNTQIGLSYSDTKLIFNDLLEQNFPRLIALAADEASKNIEKLSIRFADKYNARGLSLDDEIATPDFQFALYKAIETGARFNDDTLHDFLAELLVNRISSDKNGSTTAILNESIQTIGKVTMNQLKLLAFNFLFFDYLYKLPIKTWDEFNNYINEYVLPFMTFSYKKIDILHLDYCGCINYDDGFGRPSLSQIIKNRIPSLYPDLETRKDEQAYIDSVTQSELVRSSDFFGMMEQTKLWAIEPTSVGLMLIKVYFETEKGFNLEHIGNYFE